MNSSFNTLTSAGGNFANSAFYAAKLEIETSARRTDVPLPLSGAEVVLDALTIHQDKLFSELEWYRDDWARETKQKGKPYPVNEIIRLMEQIKFINGYINLLATEMAVDLREIGNTLLKKEVDCGH